MKLRLTLLFLLASFFSFSQGETNEFELEYTDHYGTREVFIMEFYLKNNCQSLKNLNIYLCPNKAYNL